MDVPTRFKEAARDQNVRVLIDEGGVSIARETKVVDQVYAHALDVTKELENPAAWMRLFTELDRRFASLLAYHGIIPLPEEYRK